jgi:flagellar hook-basal body complex protein FliE
MTPITAIRPAAIPDLGSAPIDTKKGAGFSSMFENYIGQVQRAQDVAQQSQDNFLSGGKEELHSVALATQRAGIEFEMFLQVRNKVVSAYQEIMKMQI